MVHEFLEGMDVKRRRQHYALGTVVVLLSAVYCTFFSPTFMLSRQWIPLPNVTFNIAFLPVVLLAGLFGYVHSMILCLILLFCFMIQNVSSAFYVIIYVMVSGVVYFAAKQGWLIDIRKIFLTGAICALIIGNGEYLLLCISFPQGFQYYSFFGQFALFISAVPECLLVLFGLYVFYRYGPDSFKEQYFCGFFYTWNYQRYILTKQKHRGLRSLGAHVSAGLILDLVAMIGLTIFLTYTLMTHFFIQNVFEDKQQLSDEQTIYVSDLHFMLLIENKNINQNEADISDISINDRHHGFLLVSFFLQLGLVLLSAMIPVIVLSNFAAQKLAVDPIRQLSEYIDGYVKTPERERPRYTKVTTYQEPYFHDEIWDAYQALRVLVEDVEAYVAKIQETQSLENTLKIAQAANQAKSNFLSNISHEIRTPINAVLGMDEMILRESHEPNTIEYAMDIQNAGKTLLSLINDILDFSKIEAGMMDIIPVQYDLTSTINDLYNMTSFRAKEKNLKLIFEFDEDMPHVLIGDEIRIKQCVLNVLNNAVKYTEEGSITLNMTYDCVSSDDIYLNVKVTDTGIGIKKADMDKLFAPFQRIDERNNLTVEGTGLGMSIVRNLLHAMGSELQVESEFGKGSAFYFRILQRVVSWEPIGDFSKIYREMNENKEKLYETFHAPEARILAVDDTQMNLSVVQGLLKPTQVQVDTALSGEAALKKMEVTAYDMILIDYRMPGMDGVELLHAIRTREHGLNQSVPCIVLTANAISGAREEYLHSGFDDYLAKPVNGQLLEQMVARYISPEKIVYEGMAGYEENPPDENDLEVEIQIREALKNAKMLNVDKALEFCDTAVVLRDALEEFYLSIDAKTKAIEGYAIDKDFRNYTILVHALKSSARLIGASQLSSYAAYLEECGDNEREDKIRELTPELLRQYRALEPIIATLFVHPDDGLPEISIEELHQAWNDIRELLEVYDYTSADRVMEMLRGYRIPEKEKEKYHKVRELMAAVDRDQLLEILSEGEA